MKYGINSRLFNKLILFLSVLFVVIEIVSAFVLYETYGKGLMYYLFIIIPSIYLLIGISGAALSKWWILLLVSDIILFVYIVVTSANNIIISTPKTLKSNRVITLPEGLKKCLKEYTERNFRMKETDRLFPFNKSYLTREMKIGCERSGVKKIRIHDLRHSHASLLVEMGFSPLLIAERLGHEKVQTTLETYCHLYPNKQIEVADKLDDLIA